MSFEALELKTIKEQVRSHCAFTLGMELIDALEPSFDKLVIERENKRIKEALDCVVHYREMPFSGIRDIRNALNAALKGRMITPIECLYVADFIRGVQGIHTYISEVTSSKEELLELIDTLVVFDALKKELESCFNEYGDVVDSASYELSMIRREIRRTEEQLHSAANKFVQTHANSVADGIITTRNNRVCVLIKDSYKNSFGGIVYGSSASGAASYVEPSALMPLNNKKQSLLYDEEKEIEEILKRCSALIKDKAETLLAEVETCAILDALFAKAIWGLQHEACVAELVDEGLVLIKAKHPLIDKDKVVANTYRLEPPYRMLLITGPNTGGKTVSLKVIALSVVMTYCGMPIICDEAKIPYFDQLFIDIGDDQSVQESLSTFSAHLSKLARVSRLANTNSLVLLDEIGSGTDPKEGEALAIAMLDELRNQKIMTVATTHYNRLKNYGKRHDDILLASVQFDVEKLIPTYRYIEGLTGQSNAFAIARKYGLSDKVIKHAEFLRRQSKTQEEQLIEKLEQQLLENQELKDNLELQKTKLEQQLKEVEAKQRKLDRDLEVSRDKAEIEAEKYLNEVRKEADELMDLLRHADTNVKMHELIDLKKQLDTLGEKEEISMPVVHKEFEVGDTVELKNSHQLGVIKAIERNQIHVDVNGILVKTKAKQLLPSDKKIVKKKQVVSVRNTSLPTSFPLECNLIGMRVEEGMEVMDKYIDNAKMLNIKSVRIIHGDGSGALRKAVHERLRKDKQVDSFRLGAPNEGSTGATVVTFKG